MEEKRVGPGKIIEIKYELRENNSDGQVLEIMDEQWPLKFLFGKRTMLPVFEEYLSVLEEGQRFEFTLDPEDAYGLHDIDQVVMVYKQELVLSDRHPYEMLDSGDYVQLQTVEGKKLTGAIKDKTDLFLVVDCNHSMAGKKLHFKGQILFIRPARADEIEAGRYIEPNGFRSQSTLRQPPNE